MPFQAPRARRCAAWERSFPADRDRWLKVHDEIYEEIMDRGWNPDLTTFVQAYDSDILDASNLIMPLVFFVAAKGPRMLGTLDASNRSPKDGGLVSNGLVHRYDVEKSPDSLRRTKGRSACARSGSSKRSRARAASIRSGSSSSRC